MTTPNTPPLTPTARQGNTAFAMSVALLFLRLALAWVFIFHGGQKLFGWFTPDGHPMVNMLAQGLAAHPLPIFPPIVWAYIAACGEFFGGLSMALGLLARLGAIPLIITMLVAIATVHGKNGFGGMMDPATGKFLAGYEYNIALIALAASVLIAGPGLLSADAFLFRRSLYARGPQPLDNPIKRA